MWSLRMLLGLIGHVMSNNNLQMTDHDYKLVVDNLKHVYLIKCRIVELCVSVMFSCKMHFNWSNTLRGDIYDLLSNNS